MGAIDARQNQKESVELVFPPLPPAFLRGVRGISFPLGQAILDLQSHLATSELENAVLSMFLQAIAPERGDFMRSRAIGVDRSRFGRMHADYLEFILGRSTPSSRQNDLHYRFEQRLFRMIRDASEEGRITAPSHALEELLHRIRDIGTRGEAPPATVLYERVSRLLGDILGVQPPPSAPKPRRAKF